MTKWKVGITGGIGSGKTFCAQIFRQLGIPIYFADERAKYLMESSPEVKTKLIGLLGQKAFDKKGRLEKMFLREQVFENTEMREAINHIVHPAVGRDYEIWHRNQNSPYTMKEAALLVESRSYLILDHLIMVKSPIATRTLRIMSRDNIDIEAIQMRFKSQLPDKNKEAVADMVIDNSGCFALLPQVLTIHRKLMNIK